MNQKQLKKLKQLREYLHLRQDLIAFEDKICRFDWSRDKTNVIFREIWPLERFIQSQIDELAESKELSSFLKKHLYGKSISLEHFLEKVINEKEPKMEM